MRSIAVVGGGISGLAAALQLQDLAKERQLPLRVTLYELSERVGGCIETWREHDCILESGADSLLVDKPAGIRLLKRLQLDSDLVAMRPEFKGARILHRGKLRPLPAHFRLFAPSSLGALAVSGLFSLAGLVRAATEPLIPPRKSESDESLASFVTRRFGREVLERLAQPLLAGIYSADPERLSMQATLPQFVDMEKRYGSLMRAMGKNGGAIARPQLMSLRGGLQSLVDALDRELHGIERVREGVRDVRVLRRRHDGAVLAVPAYASAEIVRSEDPVLAELLERIHYNSIATVNLGYARNAVPDLPRTQGFIVPYVERRKIVAATIVSQKYPERSPANIVVLRAFLGGALQPDMLQLSDADLEQTARAEFADMLGIRATPSFVRISRTLGLLPEYAVGHTSRVAEIERRAGASGYLALAGSAYRGVGIPDCIDSGEGAARRLMGIIYPR